MTGLIMTAALLALSASTALSAITLKQSFDGTLPEGSNPRWAQLDADPQLEVFGHDNRYIRIIDSATGAIEIEVDAGGTDIVLTDLRIAVYDLDGDGLAEVIVSAIRFNRSYGGPMWGKTLVFDTDVVDTSAAPIHQSSLPPLQLDGTMPEPAVDTVNIDLSLNVTQPVTVRIIDVGGRLVRTIADKASLEAGSHRLTWDGMDRHGREADSGVYFVMVSADGRTDSRRITLVR